ncbi:MAG: hypothetical protein II820_09825 [Ruminiclostridium sp.]|nr:hypothetical protein [Ruminiclostridium sp.]
MITIIRNPDIADKLVFDMKEDGKRVGGITAKLSPDGDVVITGLESEKELYYDGLCRSVLAYANVRGINRAIFDIDDERQLYRLKGFGFITDYSRVLENITEFFSRDCGGQNT